MEATTIRHESQTTSLVSFDQTYTNPINGTYPIFNYYEIGQVYFTDLQQLLNWIEIDPNLNIFDLKKAIKETIKQGYKLQKNENI